MRIVLLRKVPEEASLLRQWNDLVLQMKRPEVFYNCEWTLAEQSAYQNSRKPLLFLGYDADDLVGVACLSADSSQEQNVSFLTANTADYCEFVSPPHRRKEFVDAVFAELKRMSVGSLVLANLPADSGTPPALRAAAKKNGFHLYLRPAYFCPQVKLGTAVQRQELSHTIAHKRQMRRCLRALEREGPLTCNYFRSWAQVEPVLPDFTRAHVARFQNTKHVSFLSAPERQVFMQELARRSCDNGTMTLTVLKIADHPIAWSYGFQFHGIWFLYQTTFDIRYEENSPGYCLLGKILIDACEMKTLKAVDLGLGAESYKEWFANGSRQTLYATLTTSPLHHFTDIARYRVASGLKRFPKLDSTIRTVQSKLRRLKSS